MQSTSQERVNEPAGRTTDYRKCGTRRGQAGLEMMAFVAFILLAFSVAYISLSSKTISAIDSGANEVARRTSDMVASEVNAAVAEGSGYSKTFTLPEKIQGSTYTITIEQGLVFVDWNGKSVASNIVVNNITGSFTQGVNTIENRGGIILAN